MPVSELARITRARNALLGGRPKGSKQKHTLDVIEARKWLVQQVVANIEPLFQVLLKRALEGDMVAFKELFDRSFGKSAQALEITGKGGAPIVFMPLELINKHALIEGEEVSTLNIETVKEVPQKDG